VSDDEIPILFVSSAVGAIAWILWYWQVGLAARRCSPLRARWASVIAPLLCGWLLYTVLRRWASADVRDSREYLLFYEAMGAAWVGAALWLLPFFGLSPRDDVIERGNQAAGIALAGAMLGLTLCFAGGNIGDGPGWWVVVFSALLATTAFFLLWTALDRATGLADAVTIDRDLAAGLRLAGFFTGAGLILGRAVAGTWESLPATVTDFAAVGWPVVPLWLLAAALERGLRPTPAQPARPVVRDGLIPALLYAAAGLFGAWLAGPWT
jgi:uncharacterized membrane protein YjfL (UPF0719 family)